MSDNVEAVEASERNWEQTGDTARCEFTSDEPIVTEADALRKAQIDPTVWYVKRMRIGAHEVSMKLRRQTGHDSRGKPLYVHTPIKKSNWRVSLHLERICDDVRRKAIDLLYERLAEVARQEPPRREHDNLRSRGRHAVEVGFYDTHFGAYVWHEEAYENFDLREAEEVYANAVADAMDRVRGYRVDRWILPVGQDGMHIDNVFGLTTRGTPQDADGRHAKILVAYETAIVKGVEQMLEVAPVDIVSLRGNHDEQSTHAIARILSAYFRNCKDVRVDTRPRSRKYYRYGCSVIGYAHGNEEPIGELTRLMPLEVPARVWAETTCREFHVGHWHKSKKVQTVDTEEMNGIRVWVNPSLKPTDAWHYKKGYVGARRAARTLIYEHDSGFAGFFEFEARSRNQQNRRSTVEVFGDR